MIQLLTLQDIKKKKKLIKVSFNTMKEITNLHTWLSATIVINNNEHFAYSFIDGLNHIYVVYFLDSNRIEYYLTHNTTKYFLFAYSNFDAELIKVEKLKKVIQ